MEQNNNTMWWVLGIIAVLIVIGLFVFGGRNNNEQTINNGQDDQNQQTLTARIMIDDQFPGRVVYVSSATLPQNGFVVIHEDANGQPGNIIGSRFFRRGTNPGSIELTASTVEGRRYWAMLHTDNGDGTFNATQDLPIRDAAGNIVMKSFGVSKDIPEIKG
jgi:hypothetical protein